MKEKPTDTITYVSEKLYGEETLKQERDYYYCPSEFHSEKHCYYCGMGRGLWAQAENKPEGWNVWVCDRFPSDKRMQIVKERRQWQRLMEVNE